MTFFQVHWRAALLYQKHHHVNLNVVSNWHDRLVQGAKNILEFCHRSRTWGSKTPKSKITSGTHRTAVTLNKPPGLSEQPPSSAAGRNWYPKNLGTQVRFSWISAPFPCSTQQHGLINLNFPRLGNKEEEKAFRERESTWSMSKHLPGPHLNFNLWLSAITASFLELEQPKFLTPIKCITQERTFQGQTYPLASLKLDDWFWRHSILQKQVEKQKLPQRNSKLQRSLPNHTQAWIFFTFLNSFLKGKGSGKCIFQIRTQNNSWNRGLCPEKG